MPPTEQCPVYADPPQLWLTLPLDVDEYIAQGRARVALSVARDVAPLNTSPITDRPTRRELACVMPVAG